MKNLCFRAASACSPYKPGLSQEEQMLLFTLPGMCIYATRLPSTTNMLATIIALAVLKLEASMGDTLPRIVFSAIETPQA